MREFVKDTFAWKCYVISNDLKSFKLTLHLRQLALTGYSYRPGRQVKPNYDCVIKFKFK